VSNDIISLVLSIAGLILGLISAWQQIKSLLLKVAKHGGNAAKSWVLKERSLVELYLDHPSTLVAYLGKSSVSLVLFFIALLFIRPASLQDVFGLSLAVSKALSLVPACLIGLVLGAISSRCSDVVLLAVARKGSQSAG
jgi:hypothetical protein